MRKRYKTGDETIRYFALKTARDRGYVYSADLCARYGMPKENAGQHLIRLRELGYLVEDERGHNGRIRNVITDAGLDYLEHPPTIGMVRRFDFKALCIATGIGITTKKLAQARA